MLHVIFTPDGIPGHIFAQPRDGTVPVDVSGMTDPIAFLAAHRWTSEGWVRREPEQDVQPSPEEIAAQHAAEHAAAVEARDAAVDDAIRASAVYRQFIRGELTLTSYRDAAAKIRAEVEANHSMPERPA